MHSEDMSYTQLLMLFTVRWCCLISASCCLDSRHVLCVGFVFSYFEQVMDEDSRLILKHHEIINKITGIEGNKEREERGIDACKEKEQSKEKLVRPITNTERRAQRTKG